MAAGGTDQKVKSLSLLEGWSAVRTKSGLRFLLVIATLTATMGLLATLVLYDYVAESSFIAVEPSPIAASGSLPSERPLQPRAYVDLARSNHVLTQLSATRFDLEGTSEAPAVSGSLVELLGCEHSAAHEAMACAVDQLSDRVEAWVDLTSKAVHISVRLDHPHLAESVNGRILELIGEAERGRHRDGGQSRREFTQGRLAVAHAELQGAESRLAGFRQANRAGRLYPTLELEQDRLVKETRRRAAIYTALRQSNEQDRIAELRATPVLWNLDPPEGAARPHRNPWWNTLLGFSLGLVWASVVLTAEWWVTQNRSTPDYLKLVRALGRDPDVQAVTTAPELPRTPEFPRAAEGSPA